MKHSGIRTAAHVVLICAAHLVEPVRLSALARIVYDEMRRLRGLPELPTQHRTKANNLSLASIPSAAHIEHRSGFRNAQRCIQRCYALGYLIQLIPGPLAAPLYRISLEGLFALASHPMGRLGPQQLALLTARMGHDELLSPILTLAHRGHQHATVLASYLHWRHVAMSLGGKVSADPRQLALPHTSQRSTGVERANTGAPPQPPYTPSGACHGGVHRSDVVTKGPPT